jgi:hypothetical protein
LQTLFISSIFGIQEKNVMNERQSIDQELSAIEAALKTLETRFEQYLAGVEKRAPILERDRLALRVRKLGGRRITQTDLRFRFQNLATRFQTYSGHWDRILRQVEEGRRVRPVVANGASSQQPSRLKSAPSPQHGGEKDEVEAVYRQLVAARGAVPSGEGALPDREQLRAFIEKQRAQIVEKFGDREVEFIVEFDKSRPRIKVRAKR